MQTRPFANNNRLGQSLRLSQNALIARSSWLFVRDAACFSLGVGRLSVCPRGSRNGESEQKPEIPASPLHVVSRNDIAAAMRRGRQKRRSFWDCVRSGETGMVNDRMKQPPQQEAGRAPTSSALIKRARKVAKKTDRPRARGVCTRTARPRGANRTPNVALLTRL